MKLKSLGLLVALGMVAFSAGAVEKMRLGHGLPEDHAVRASALAQHSCV